MSASSAPPSGWSARNTASTCSPERAQHRIDLLAKEVDEYYGHFRVTPDLIELRNLLEVARLVVRSALRRKESRGLHYTLDYPDMLPEAVDTVLTP
jgi:Aspartate oxidase